jgi:four helix bundle protein
MSTINRFEDLQVWKTARILNKKVYELSQKGSISRDFSFRDQVRIASVSVMSNIAEGFDSETQALFRTYLGRVRASAGEVRCQLYIALDLGYITEDEFKSTSRLAEECSRQLFGFIKYLRSQPNTKRIK